MMNQGDIETKKRRAASPFLDYAMDKIKTPIPNRRQQSQYEDSSYSIGGMSEIEKHLLVEKIDEES